MNKAVINLKKEPGESSHFNSVLKEFHHKVAAIFFPCLFSMKGTRGPNDQRHTMQRRLLIIFTAFDPLRGSRSGPQGPESPWDFCPPRWSTLLPVYLVDQITWLDSGPQGLDLDPPGLRCGSQWTREDRGPLESHSLTAALGLRTLRTQMGRVASTRRGNVPVSDSSFSSLLIFSYGAASCLCSLLS